MRYVQSKGKVRNDILRMLKLTESMYAQNFISVSSKTKPEQYCFNTSFQKISSHRCKDSAQNSIKDKILMEIMSEVSNKKINSTAEMETEWKNQVNNTQRAHLPSNCDLTYDGNELSKDEKKEKLKFYYLNAKNDVAKFDPFNKLFLEMSDQLIRDVPGI